MAPIRLFTIPNLLTLSNLLCGCGATLAVLRFDDLRLAFWLIIAAAIFDFLDGFAARSLGSYSALGKELDSLSDVVSFGVAPSAVLYTLYVGSGGEGLVGVAVFILAACSALRLAKFNIDESQGDQFIGLPTPAAALFVASSGYLLSDTLTALNPYYTIATAITLSYFLLCNTPMFALKFKHYKWRGNELRYGFAAGSLIALIVVGIVAIPLLIFAYILLSTLLHTRRR